MYSRGFVNVTDSRFNVALPKEVTDSFNVAEMFLTTEKARAYRYEMD